MRGGAGARRGCVSRTLRAVAVLALMAVPAGAVQPDEMLEDPGLEARAREISADLRCLVCRNESIDASNADFARDLRLVVRERLVAGDTDAEVKDFLVARYGEYVLLKPQWGGANLILWLAGPAMLLVGLGLGAAFLRRRAGSEDAAGVALSADEKARLEKILSD
ncbi:MAG: cytochrome c-type biogenesis protein [Pseudomonadota bacterium]